MNRIAVLAAAVAVLALACGAHAADSDDVLFRFAILSDRTGGHAPGVYPRVIEAINQQKPDFVVTVGDHIEGYGEDYERVIAEWDSVLAFIRGIEAPVYLTPGNHDIWDGRSEEVYLEKTGRKPYYSFDYGSTHFVVLDDSRIESWDSMGALQFTWLVHDLQNADSRHTFVFFHKPLWDQTVRRGKPDRLHEVFTDYGVDAVFSGHYHTFLSADYDGVEYTVIGSSGAEIAADDAQSTLRGEFYQFAMVDVTKDGYELTIHALRDGAVYPRDFVTVDLLDEIERIEDRLVTVSALRIAGDDAAASAVELSIENATGETVEGEVEWNVPEQWRVEPPAVPYSIEPGGTDELTFTASRSGEIYPVPSLSLEYPLADGRTLLVDKPAKVLRTIPAPRVSGQLVLDGNVDGFMRESGARVAELYPGYGYEQVEGKTEFLFANDGKNLMVSAVCFDDKMNELKATARERDGAVYMDDCVGLFLQPDPDEMVVYQLYVNADGVVFDQKITFDETMWYTVHPDWNGEYGVATSRDADSWTAEILIPFETLRQGGAVSKGPGAPTAAAAEPATWRLNFRRKQQRTSASADWQVPIDYDPGTFGEIDLQ